MNTEELNMTTQELIKNLRQLLPLGPQIAMLVSEAADRLEELQNERDEARAEVERLKQELTEAIRERNKTVAELINQRDEQRVYNQFTFTHRPEPSRLEIAAMAMQGMLASGDMIIDIPNTACKYADSLIAAASEERK
jgi:chromosome segregation ATPase